MSSNKQVICLTSIICGVTFALTFLVCLNISYQCFDLIGLSNTFLLTIFGGIFASAAVVWLCELQKYYMNKRSAEDALWSSTVQLYIRLVVIRHGLENLINFPHQLVTVQMFDASKSVARNILNNAYYIDYSPFSRRNKLLRALIDFQKNTSVRINKWLDELSVLDIAINTSLIDKLKEQSCYAKEITAASPLVAQTVKILYKNFDEAIVSIEEFLQSIDYCGRYSWKEVVSTVKREYSDLKDFNFEEFLNQYRN